MSRTSYEKGHDHTVERAPVRRTKKGRVAACCKKFWWAWLIGTIIFLGIVAVIIIFAILPKVAQSKVDDADLTLHSLEIRDPTPQSFRLTMNSSVHVGHGIGSKATIDPMDADLYISDKDKPFMTIPVPKVHGEGDVPVNNANHLVNIENMPAMDEFVAALMDNTTLNFKLYGRTKLWLGKIKTMINYNQDIEMKGLQKLSGMQIEAIKMLAGSQPDGANMSGNVTIPNPTIVTVEMGTVGLKIGLAGKSIGVGSIPNLILIPGTHQYTFRANIPDAADQISVLLSAQKGQMLEIGSNGTMVGGQKIEWLSKPFEAIIMKVPVNLDAK